jgi:hypothetical protein
MWLVLAWPGNAALAMPAAPQLARIAQDSAQSGSQAQTAVQEKQPDQKPAQEDDVQEQNPPTSNEPGGETRKNASQEPSGTGSKPSAVPEQNPEVKSGTPAGSSAQAPAGEESKQPATKAPAKKTTKKKKKRHDSKEPAQTEPAKQETPGPDPAAGKVVVKEGSTPDPTIQLSTGPNKQQAPQQVQNTNQLLAATDENLKKAAGRQLNSNQQEMVKQIHMYMEQSKAATESGDLVSARNLAIKAQLLSQEIVKE